MQQQVILSAKFRAKSSHIFMQLPWNVAAVCGIDCLACQDIRENYEHALDFALHCLASFRCRSVWTFRAQLMPSSPNACPIIARISHTFSEIYTKFDAVPFLDPSWNRIGPDTRLQIKGRKESAHPPSCVKFCISTPKICWYYHLRLHSTATTVVHMAAPIPEIMDILS
jgi:hypothetical protein